MFACIHDVLVLVLVLMLLVVLMGQLGLCRSRFFGLWGPIRDLLLRICCFTESFNRSLSAHRFGSAQGLFGSKSADETTKVVNGEC